MKTAPVGAGGPLGGWSGAGLELVSGAQGSGAECGESAGVLGSRWSKFQSHILEAQTKLDLF